MKNRKLLCRRPFEAVEVETGGDVRVCCWAENYKIGNVSRQSITSIWNSPKAVEFRESMYDGSYRFCDKNRCPFLSDANPRHSEVLIDVSRSVEELKLKLPWDVADSMKNEDRLLHYSPKSTTLSYDQTCNLSCPSCRKRVINQNRNKDEFQTFFEQLKPFGEHLILSGAGDPFASSHFLDLLFNSSERELHQVRRISIITNGVLLTKSLWEKVSPEIKKRTIELSISIDAANEETFLINRRGGNWKRLIENLEFIKDCEDFKTLELSFVIHPNNFRQMKDFVTLARKYNADRIIFRKLSNWGTYSPEEYATLNLFSKSHPDYQEFMKLLRDPIFLDPRIEIPPPDLERVQIDDTVRPGIYYAFLSQTIRDNFIDVSEQNQLFAFNKTYFETDYLEMPKGVFSRKVIAGADDYMGFGFHHNQTFDLSSYKRLNLTLKTNENSPKSLFVLLTDSRGEYRINLENYGLKHDGRFHDIQIPLIDFQNGGIDLSKVIYSFAIVADGIREGDYFFINDIFID